VDYITKPFSLEEVVARIENQLTRQRLQHQLRQANEVLERRVTKRTEALTKTVASLEEQISERKKTEAALQQYADRLRVLHRIDRDILAAQTPETTAQAAINHLPDLIPCQWAGAVLFDVEANKAVLLAARGDGNFSVGLEESFPLEHVGSLEDLGQGHLLVEDLSAVPVLSQVDQGLIAAGLQSRIQAPLISRDELLGCLILANITPGIFSVEHSAITEEVATQLALALDNARLHSETQRRARELAALNKASRAMASTLDLKTVLAQTMAELRTLLEEYRAHGHVAVADFHARGVGGDEGTGDPQLLILAQQTIRILCLERQPQDCGDWRQGDITLIPVKAETQNFTPFEDLLAHDTGVAHGRRIGSGNRRSQCETGYFLSAGQPRQVVLLLVLRSVVQKEFPRPERIRNHDSDRRRKVSARELHNHRGIGLG
jgi:GAF domain-containing protein